MAKKQNLYLQTAWVEKEILRQKKLRDMRIYIWNFEANMVARYGSDWRRTQWDEMSMNARMDARRLSELKNELIILELPDRKDNYRPNYKPPPLM